MGDSRKTIGLRDKIESPESELKENITSKKAQDIIDKSRARAMESLVKKTITADSSEKLTVSAQPKKKGRLRILSSLLKERGDLIEVDIWNTNTKSEIISRAECRRGTSI